MLFVREKRLICEEAGACRRQSVADKNGLSYVVNIGMRVILSRPALSGSKH